MVRVQLISLFVYGLFGVWYVAPLLQKTRRTEALTALLWINVLRYMVFYVFVAQRDGYDISRAAALELAAGDLAGAGLALAAIALLRYRLRAGLWLCWLLIAETVVDVAVTSYQRTIDPPRLDASGPWWFVFAFYAPLVPVSLALLGWQLYKRRDEWPVMSRAT
jgi:hypothetical protein